MILVEFRDVEVDYCPECRGAWLDAGELSRVLSGTERSDLLRIEGGRRGARRCPHCRRRMAEGNLPGSRVTLDECPSGHGVWLDGGELEAVIREAAPERAMGSLARHCADVFGSRGQTGTIKEERRL